MEQNGKSRYDVCDALGIKYSTFADWFNGVVYPRIGSIEMLADYFGIRKSDLIESGREPDHVMELLQALKTRPEMMTLFSVSATATVDEILEAVRLIDRLKAERGNV